jgi:hypothetical protein
MDILQRVWMKELSEECEYIKEEELFYTLEDEEDYVGLAFMDNFEAIRFHESVNSCISQIRKYMDIKSPEINTWAHVSGIKSGSGTGIFEIVNNLADLGDPALRKMFSSPFKSDTEANHCIATIRSQTLKHKIEIGKRFPGMKKVKKPKKTRRLSPRDIGNPDVHSFMHVSGTEEGKYVNNINELDPAVRKLFSSVNE